MDHPNGMCTMEPKIDMDKTIDQLADWFNAEDGTYPEIDKFASNFGYVPNVSPMTEEQKKWLNMAGYTNGQMPKDFTEFAHNLTFDQQSELLKAAGGSWSDPHPYQVMEKYYNANIAKAGGQAAVKAGVGQVAGVESLGTSSGKTFNYWYTKLSDEQKEIMNGTSVAMAHLANAVKNIRNDINHFGFREGPKRSNNLTKDLYDYFSKFADEIGYPFETTRAYVLNSKKPIGKSRN